MPLPDLATVEADLAAAEAGVGSVRPGCEKRIIWAGERATQTKISVVYIHGFSATGEELRPLPDLVADGLGANLFFTRLTGHGQDGAAMARATLAAWQSDVEEALAVAGTIGERVVVIGCSTGCTLMTLALANGARVAGVVHVSPNFGLAHRAAQMLLDLPGARHWAKYVAGGTRRFPAMNDEHAAFWTLSYPTSAVHVMADTVRAARKASLESISVPALFCYNDADQVVDAKRITQAAESWGGPVDTIKLRQTPADDAMGHVMAGDILSPGQTAPLARQILAWSQKVVTD